MNKLMMKQKYIFSWQFLLHLFFEIIIHEQKIQNHHTETLPGKLG